MKNTEKPVKQIVRDYTPPERPPHPPKNRKPEEQRRKIIVAGSRTFSNYKLLHEKLDSILKNLEDPIIVSGHALGADRLGEDYAAWNWLVCKLFHPDWDKFGKSAGPRRNEEMAEYADGLIAFWDGKSAGTGHMIETAKKAGLKVRVINF